MEQMRGSFTNGFTNSAITVPPPPLPYTFMHLARYTAWLDEMSLVGYWCVGNQYEVKNSSTLVLMDNSTKLLHMNTTVNHLYTWMIHKDHVASMQLSV